MRLYIGMPDGARKLGADFFFLDFFSIPTWFRPPVVGSIVAGRLFLDVYF